MTNIILICLIFIGFALIIFSVFIKEKSFKLSLDEAKGAELLLNKSINDADNAIEELNKLCSDAFEEFEEKYQEMLFLYQMIDEKKKEVFEKNEIKASSGSSAKASKQKSNYTNPKLKDIRKLQKQGLTIPEIAKKLNMGQGEVKLISELGKER